MGLPIKITVVTTINDIVCRVLQNGDYTTRDIINTIACAMDTKVSEKILLLEFFLCGFDNIRMIFLQAPYNFERIVYLFGGASKANEFMTRFDKTGDSELSLDVRERVRK